VCIYGKGKVKREEKSVKADVEPRCNRSRFFSLGYLPHASLGNPTDFIGRAAGQSEQITDNLRTLTVLYNRWELRTITGDRTVYHFTAGYRYLCSLFGKTNHA
jgi:hypothetical protein